MNDAVIAVACRDVDYLLREGWWWGGGRVWQQRQNCVDRCQPDSYADTCSSPLKLCRRK